MSDDTGDKGFSVDKDILEMKSTVLEHKVFWTTVPIDRPLGEEGLVRVGMAIALVGTDSERETHGDKAGKSATFDKLDKLARWLTSEPQPGIRFDIRWHDNVVFFLPEDLRTNRSNYVVSIRIFHSEQLNLPMDESQSEILRDLEKKLKEIDSPREHWKEPHTAL